MIIIIIIEDHSVAQTGSRTENVFLSSKQD